MRCSQCRYMASDKRDLCPKCLFDLRPEKTKMGLVVSQPHASYEELVEDLKKNLSQDRRRPSSSGSKTKSQRSKTRPVKHEAQKSILVKFFKKLFPSRTTGSPPAEITPPSAPEQSLETIAPETVKDLIQLSIEGSQHADNIENGAANQNTQNQNIHQSLPEQTSSTTPNTADAKHPSDLQNSATILDELAFESLFEEPEETPIVKSIDSPLSYSTALPPGVQSMLKLESMDQPTDSSSQESSTSGDQGYLPPSTYSGSLVAPQVLEFDEHDDCLLEEQLDQMIGEEILEVSAVKTTAQKPTPPATSQSVELTPGLEISFEFDLESSESEQLGAENLDTEILYSESINEMHDALVDPAPESELAAQSSPEEMLKTLEAALGSLESALDEQLIAPGIRQSNLEETLTHELSQMESQKKKVELPQIPRHLRSNPEALSAYLLNYLAGALDCSAEQLFEPDDYPEELEEEPFPELEEEDMSPEISVDAAPIPLAWRGAREQVNQLLPPPSLDPALGELQNELDQELSALSEDGCSIFSSEPPDELLSLTERSTQNGDSESLGDSTLESNQLGTQTKAPAEIPNTSTTLHRAIDDKQDDQELLWNAVEEELKKSNTDYNLDEEELSLFVPSKPDEKLLLLFDSALATIENPEIERSYQNTINTSVSKEIDTEQLKKVFDEYGDQAAAEHLLQKKLRYQQPSVLPEPSTLDIGIVGPAAQQHVPLLFSVRNIFLSFVGAGLYLWYVACTPQTRGLITLEGVYWPIFPYLSQGIIAALALFQTLQIFSRPATPFDSSDTVE